MSVLCHKSLHPNPRRIFRLLSFNVDSARPYYIISSNRSIIFLVRETFSFVKSDQASTQSPLSTVNAGNRRVPHSHSRVNTLPNLMVRKKYILETHAHHQQILRCNFHWFHIVNVNRSFYLGVRIGSSNNHHIDNNTQIGVSSHAP